MRIVYVVTRGEPYEGSDPIMVFDTESKAVDYVKDCVNKSDGFMQYDYEGFEVN